MQIHFLRKFNTSEKKNFLPIALVQKNPNSSHFGLLLGMLKLDCPSRFGIRQFPLHTFRQETCELWKSTSENLANACLSALGKSYSVNYSQFPIRLSGCVKYQTENLLFFSKLQVSILQLLKRPLCLRSCVCRNRNCLRFQRLE